MLVKRTVLSLAVAGMVLVGCKQKSSSTTPPVAPPPAAPAMPAIPATQPSASTAIPAAPALPATPALPAPASPAALDAASGNEEAKTTLAQLQKDLGDKKWDAAHGDIKKLEGMKDSLSPAEQETLKTAKAQLAAEKAAGDSGIKVPNLPGGSTDSNK